MEISDIRSKQSFSAAYFKCNGVWYRVADGWKYPSHNMSKSFNKAKSKVLLTAESSDMYLLYGNGSKERCGIKGLPFIFTGKEARDFAKFKKEEICTFFNNVFKTEFSFEHIETTRAKDPKTLL
jgi:hypothetical protein